MIDRENNNSNDSTTDPKNSDEPDDISNNLKWTSLKKSLNTSEIIAQAIIFLIAGYETTGTTLCFVSYNLATNMDCQQKLCEEIDQVSENHVIFHI